MSPFQDRPSEPIDRKQYEVSLADAVSLWRLPLLSNQDLLTFRT